jgi:glycolate oxidase FAD binding subunit
MLRPVQAARSLTTRNLTGITLYSPNELIISARAGTLLSDIQAALAENGQHIIAEASDTGSRQTLGGVVATNLSGPRRIAWGAMRDHVLGVRAVTGHGEVIRSGGRVLKNVTGLDLCKLLTGSHGTLAVITEVTLKVLPAPEAVGTLVLPGLDAVAGVAALSAALGSPYSVSAAAWLPAEAAARIPALAGSGRPVALARIEEFSASVEYRCRRLRDELAAAGSEILDDAVSRTVWRAIRDRAPLGAAPDEAVWRVSVAPSVGASVLQAVADACGARGYLDWGGGLVWLAGPASVAAHAAVQAGAQGAGGTWMLMQGPDTLRVAVDVVPPEPEPLARITRRVKAALDPNGILNPGRLYAGL